MSPRWPGWALSEHAFQSQPRFSLPHEVRPLPGFFLGLCEVKAADGEAERGISQTIAGHGAADLWRAV